MILKTKGETHNIPEGTLVRVTRYRNKLEDKSYAYIAECDIDIGPYVNKPILTTANINTETIGSRPVVCKMSSTDHLAEDDIVLIGQRGNIRTLYRPQSISNVMFITERCNSNCLMCSQPPMDNDDLDFHYDINSRLISMIPKDCPEITLTGGEPTILGNRLCDLINQIKNELPRTEVHMLTNGRSFAYNKVAERLAQVNNPRLMLGIPLYSDYYQIHDYVVQAKDAFYQTVMGIQNLKRYDIRVEIRVVLHKATIPRLQKLAEFIFKNLPFVDQIVLMGLEITGYTKANLNDLWIDPKDYMDELRNAVNYLAKRKMKVAIYNTPLCLLPLDIWDYARQSISDWKNIYFEECEKCMLINECGGLFESALKRHSNHIKAFKEDPRTTLSGSSEKLLACDAV